MHFSTTHAGAHPFAIAKKLKTRSGLTIAREQIQQTQQTRQTQQMEIIDHNIHTKTYSYHQACTNDATARREQIRQIQQMEVIDHNIHAKTYSYHQACTNDATVRHYLNTHYAAQSMQTTHAEMSPRAISYHAPTASSQSPSAVHVLPPIIYDPELHISAFNGRLSGCICVFCEHRFVHEMHNIHQAEKRARDFHNDTIHSDYCKNCSRSGGIMRSADVYGQNLVIIRNMLTDLINTRNTNVYVENIISP